MHALVRCVEWRRPKGDEKEGDRGEPKGVVNQFARRKSLRQQQCPVIPEALGAEGLIEDCRDKVQSSVPLVPRKNFPFVSPFLGRPSPGPSSHIPGPPRSIGALLQSRVTAAHERADRGEEEAEEKQTRN
ncbi:hypothetical protein KM043_005331 [Ampulex compressa]|nr:hypothetical protein KM043_005331 [Ampulex compressa]